MSSFINQSFEKDNYTDITAAGFVPPYIWQVKQMFEWTNVRDGGILKEQETQLHVFHLDSILLYYLIYSLSLVFAEPGSRPEWHGMNSDWRELTFLCISII